MVILRLALAGTLLLGAGCSDSGAAGSADGAETPARRLASTAIMLQLNPSPLAGEGGS